MKKPQSGAKTFLFTIVLILNLTSFCFANRLNFKIDSTKSKTISFKIKLKSADKITIKPSALKFDKHLAYSFTVDDGYRSAYLIAFPLFNGGKISGPMINEWKNDQGGDGTNSKGLFYSNGLGNKIPFKLGLAINGGAIGDFSAYRGHLSWAEVKEMYDAGWDILNHGFHHATKHGTNFLTEVTENTTSIQQNLGFTMSHFVVPGGESDPGYQLEYEKDALANGSFSVASYVGLGPVINVKDKVNLDKMIYGRTFLQSSKDTIGFKTMDRFLATFDSVAKLPNPIWYNEFTHGVGNGNLWNLSMRFPDFKYYMTAIANKYGSKGNDSIWMAPWQEVYEYIWLRDRIKIKYTQNNKEVIVTIELPEIPKTFRNRDISLTIDTSSKFEIESDSSDFKISSDGKTKHKLINIQLK
ncbi:polysaccharide deacetylase family protein [Flavobacterium sp. ANB]|uniref:polysaccharide deacetylase family protein n=1 Tax=unclassified Flavobacterium TaxID=196869 RepID=UPI0012B8ED13|nr:MULTISPECIES: polysaccharide deacetylase family protein [unclassified Flavobacterium]MBF4519278.1 polysaccharide deacetylase family protein [Flavobacterium sp. ANB]MTD71918.1 polysaccharide deacetylase family protein [Flavobacterium sp. LC2016-13]